MDITLTIDGQIIELLPRQAGIIRWLVESECYGIPLRDLLNVDGPLQIQMHCGPDPADVDGSVIVKSKSRHKS